MAHDVAGLEQKVRALHDAIFKLHDAKHTDRLLQVIRRPGWTTVREHELVQVHADGLNSQITSLHKSFDALMTIAEKIGR